MVWSTVEQGDIELPEKVKSFYSEIEQVCMKYNFSISHEDGHGAFELEEFSHSNMEWLRNAHITFKI